MRNRVYEMLWDYIYLKYALQKYASGLIDGGAAARVALLSCKAEFHDVSGPVTPETIKTARDLLMQEVINESAPMA